MTADVGNSVENDESQYSDPEDFVDEIDDNGVVIHYS